MTVKPTAASRRGGSAARAALGALALLAGSLVGAGTPTAMAAELVSLVSR